jgi:glycosyltransferase involved in cell wall biosynthesis
METRDLVQATLTSERRAATLLPAGVSRCRTVLMVGPGIEGMGGMASVVMGYIEAGLFDRFRGIYVATHRGGSFWRKLRAAVGGLSRVVIELFRLEAPLVHVMVATRASFWRKSLVCLLARMARRPFLLHVHGSEFMQFYDKECSAAGKWIIGRIFSWAALVVALSEEWRTNLLKICPSMKIEVLPNGVALPEIRHSPAQTMARHPVAEGQHSPAPVGPPPPQPMARQPPVLAGHSLAPLEPPPAQPVAPRTVLTLGRLGQRKGTYDLVRAFALIAGRVSDAQLVCGGDGDIEQVRALAQELGVGDRVICPGWLGAEGKRAHLAEAAVFILPSTAEGMPMAVLEAMSWRLAVIATPVGGVPQVIQHDRNGMLVEPGDIEAIAAALLRLLDDVALRERLGTAARATIETRFSIAIAVERLSAIYGRFGIAARVAGER